MFLERDYIMWLYFIKSQEISLEMFGKTTNELTYDQLDKFCEELSKRDAEIDDCKITESGRTRNCQCKKLKLEFLEFINKKEKGEK